jgi:5-methylcytosine-specific restriction endonuclease McrA
MKKCTKCREEQPEDEFSVRKSGRIERQCKSCVRYRSAEWYANNPERGRTRSAQWAQENHDRKKETEDQWRQENAARVHELGIAAVHRRHVLLRGGIVEKFTHTEIFDRDEYICQICCVSIDPSLGNRHPMMASLDHIVPISKGGSHTRSNVQTAHLQCNRLKSDRI